jgi:hypothetical protein
VHSGSQDVVCSKVVEGMIVAIQASSRSPEQKTKPAWLAYERDDWNHANVMIARRSARDCCDRHHWIRNKARAKSRLDGGIVRPIDTKETEHERTRTAGMRELTAEELDQVTGGLAANSQEVEWVLIGVTLGTLFITGVTALWDWLFG